MCETSVPHETRHGRGRAQRSAQTRGRGAARAAHQLLSPKNYYQLYMQVLDELRHLEMHVEELQASGTSIRSLYERVQSSGNVLPRLYLLVTVGSVYIKSKQAPAREVLTDLVEMTKGVQHPLRGLFLRHYLSITVKDKLPDVGSPYEGTGGSVDDAIAFLLLNLRETNRLWIRLQSQKANHGSKDKATLEKARQELRLLVGTSLVRLSQMEGMTASVYTTQVFPQVLEIVVGCKDKLAQEYLMECVIQVFPDEFHLQNLPALLRTMEDLQLSVDTAAILLTLLDRLIKFHDTGANPSLLKRLSSLSVVPPVEKKDDPNTENDVFSHIMANVEKQVKMLNHALVSKSEQDRMSMFSLLVAMTRFATLPCFAEQTVMYARQVVDATFTCLQQGDSKPEAAHHQHVREILLTLFKSLPVDQLRLLGAAALAKLTKTLPWSTTRKALMLEWINILVKRRQRVTSAADAEFLLEMLAPVIRDDPSDTSPGDVSSFTSASFAMEQLELGKLLQLLSSPENLDAQFEILGVARRAFGQGGVYRIRFTLVPLIFSSLSSGTRPIHSVSRW
ncbi:hypothetical protein PINS_up016222 [Pythium insidiosum]|nr:hypothetical protein PINS_up016222 [Pythium insidiosum]